MPTYPARRIPDSRESKIRLLWDFRFRAKQRPWAGFADRINEDEYCNIWKKEIAILPSKDMLLFFFFLKYLGGLMKHTLNVEADLRWCDLVSVLMNFQAYRSLGVWSFGIHLLGVVRCK